MLSLGLALLGALAVPEGAPENPLAPTEAGNVQCYDPDEARKTCRSISSYRALGGQRYSSTTTVLVSRMSSMTLETTSPVEVRDGAVCGVVTAGDIAASKVRIADRLLDPAEARPYLETILQSLKALIGKEVCSTYMSSPDGAIAKVSVDGDYREDTDERMIWIGPNDLFTVSP